MAPLDILFAAGDGGDPTCIHYSKRKGWHFLENFGAAPIDNKEGHSRARAIEGQRRSLPGTDPTSTLVVVGTLRQFLELSRFALPRARDTEDYVIFELGNQNSQVAVVSLPTSKLTATLQLVKADDELRLS